ncbi:hypothetical protein [uncultured Devosia sp.]|uniref:hypothetical protein n=1 Tax=uncultured Devosia sp. TaxID=211434 RepID=UPI0035CC7F16
MTPSLAVRQLTPEQLDSLPADDPRAVGSRRDLVLVNALMFQSAIMAAQFRKHLQPGRLRLLEIGAGDGSFMLAVARRLGRRYGDVDLVLLDQANLITQRRIAQFSALGWRVKTITADVFDWIGRAEAGVFNAVSANLFLHHFEGGMLTRLLAAMPALAPVFLATEPRRNALALWGTHFLRLFGVNDVTLHDAAASVRAGFAGRELSLAWPDCAGRRLDEHRAGPFTHVFAAVHAGAHR